MIYLHEKQLDERLIRHWANEVEDGEGYEEATYRIKQMDTGVVYGEAVDVIPCRYTYEATDEPIEPEETE